MDDLRAAYERYLSAFPLRWNPEHCNPKSFEDFEFLYPFAKAARELNEKKLGERIANPDDSISMIAPEVLLGIVRAEQCRGSEGMRNLK